MRRGWTVRRDWTREETLMALALYLLLPSSHRVVRDPDIISLGKAIGRTPSAVKLKIYNLASCDPMYNGTSLDHRSGVDEKVWAEYEGKGDELTESAVRLLFKHIGIPAIIGVLDMTGWTDREREETLVARASESYFLNLVLKNYDNRCCLTGMKTRGLLTAARIKPWDSSDPIRERLTPENGLLLNTLHAQAFERGLITLDDNLQIVVSKKVKKDDASRQFIWAYKGRKIDVPGSFRPRAEFLKYHNNVVFQG